jgi:dGTPase
LRRLAATTQVVQAGVLDFPRTRLTHTLEVAQIGRELGDALGCDADLVEVACLAHDLGHPPFGHNGEQALDEAAEGIGGFEGNAQTLRVLSRLESKTFAPDGREGGGRSVGLNLTRAALDASMKYPWARRTGSAKFGWYDDDADVALWVRTADPVGRRCFEAQVMDWADDVAYSVHDVEDAVHGGLLDLAVLRDPAEQAALAALAAERYLGGTDDAALVAALRRLLGLGVVPQGYDGSQRSLAALKNLTSTLIGRFCSAAERATREGFGEGVLTRYAADLVVPDGVRQEVAVLKAVAARYVMEREGVAAVYRGQRDLLHELVAALVAAGPPSLEAWLRPAAEAATSRAELLRAVVDQVASLTDVSVVEWHARHCG